MQESHLWSSAIKERIQNGLRVRQDGSTIQSWNVYRKGYLCDGLFKANVAVISNKTIYFDYAINKIEVSYLLEHEIYYGMID